MSCLTALTRPCVRAFSPELTRSFPYLIEAAKARLESVTKKPINTVEASYSEQQAARAQVRALN